MRRGLTIMGLAVVAAACGCDDRSSSPAAALPSPADRPRAGESAGPAASPATPIALEEPTGDRPVVAAAVLQPGRPQPGQSVTLVVEVRTAPGWHIYAVEPGSGPVVPTSLTLKLPIGWTAAGEWVRPEAVSNLDGPGKIYEGAFAFRRPLTVSGQAAPGPVELACELRYQACDPFGCRPPATLIVRARAEVVASP
jgi:DsbC/DsbD-like thiol-disulfide interchange protein